ncbi:competence protein ComK [Bacillus fengqiuensis]|nr:competence protein ComK [Bacillus fengqiuensis]
MIVDEKREISLKTMAVTYYPGIKHQTMILDVDGSFLTSKSPERLFEEACLKHGSTYEGRRQAVIHVRQYWKRTPFAIAPLFGMYVFPSASPRDLDCVWLFAHHVLDILPDAMNKQHSIVKFRNDKELPVKATATFLDNQYERTGACFLRFGPLELFRPNDECFCNT